MSITMIARLLSIATIVVLLITDVAARLPLQFVRPTFLNSPFGVAFDANGNLFTAQNLGVLNINRITVNGTLLQTIPVGLQLSAIAADRNDIIFAVGPNTVIKVSGVNGTRLGTWTVAGANGIAVDSSYMYVSTTANTVAMIAVNGLLFRTINVGLTGVCGVAVDASGFLYVGTTAAVVKMNNGGTRLATFATSAPAISSALAVAVDFLGNIYVSDLYNRRVVRFNARGNVTALFNTTGTVAPLLTYPRGLAVHPTNGQLFVADQAANAIFIYETNIVACNSGASAGYTDLSQLSVNGADLQGFNAARTTLYAWSVCGGAAQNLYCAAFAGNASVCSMSLPIANIGTVARTNSPFVWETLQITDPPATGLSSVVINGDRCGRFNLASELIVLLMCANTQDVTFTMDDSLVSPSSTICLYILTLYTPQVCSATLALQQNDNARLNEQATRELAAILSAAKKQ